MQEQSTTPKELQGLDNFSKLLDTQFKIPGIPIRFGLDFLIGLIPYAGDILGFLFSAGLIITMIRHGASGYIIAKMIFNIFLDTVIGSIPIIGDGFDLIYRSNRRNYHLLREHYGEGAYEGSIWKVLLPVLLVLILIFILLIWLIFKTIGLVWDFILSAF